MFDENVLQKLLKKFFWGEECLLIFIQFYRIIKMFEKLSFDGKLS